MAGYREMPDDNGGVHIFSGIPNNAFYRVCIGLGGNSWERPGQIWWRAMRSGQVPPNCTFLQFAEVTVAMALKYDTHDKNAAAQVVRNAWKAVGVMVRDDP